MNFPSNWRSSWLCGGSGGGLGVPIVTFLENKERGMDWPEFLKNISVLGCDFIDTINEITIDHH